jgi:hypothetical protein
MWKRRAAGPHAPLLSRDNVHTVVVDVARGTAYLEEVILKT